MTESSRSKTLEVMARAICASFGDDPDSDAPVSAICGPNNEVLPLWRLFEEQAEAALTAYESHLQTEGMAVVPGWQRAALGPWSEHGTYPHYMLVYNGKHVGVGFRISPNYDDDPEWCDEGGEFIEPPVQLWMPIPKPSASPYGKAVVKEDKP